MALPFYLLGLSTRMHTELGFLPFERIEFPKILSGVREGRPLIKGLFFLTALPKKAGDSSHPEQVWSEHLERALQAGEQKLTDEEKRLYGIGSTYWRQLLCGGEPLVTISMRVVELKNKDYKNEAIRQFHEKDKNKVTEQFHQESSHESNQDYWFYVTGVAPYVGEQNPEDWNQIISHRQELYHYPDFLYRFFLGYPAMASYLPSVLQILASGNMSESAVLQVMDQALTVRFHLQNELFGFCAPRAQLECADPMCAPKCLKCNRIAR